ncbi:MAG: uroporphyrinogen-III synthase [Cyanobacteria bacterium P01_F01_bin.150]
MTVQERLPLQGKTVLVTRAASQAGSFCNCLQSRGATVIEMPTLEIVPPSSWAALDEAIAQLASFDWLILTSANGVHAFFERLALSSKEITLDSVKIAVVGKKTAASLKKYGYEPTFTPPNFVADDLVSSFPDAKTLSSCRLLFPRVESGGRAVLIKEFSKKGATVVEVPAYQSQCPEIITPTALAALQAEQVDVITFASSKTVRYFAQLFSQALSLDADSDQCAVGEDAYRDNEQPSYAKMKTHLKNACIASIGPQTSKTCREILGRVDLEAEEYTLDGLLTSLMEWSNSVNV